MDAKCYLLYNMIFSKSVKTMLNELKLDHRFENKAFLLANWKSKSNFTWSILKKNPVCQKNKYKNIGVVYVKIKTEKKCGNKQNFECWISNKL